VLPKLYFVASTLRDLGASRIGLVAPYLPYLRQDKRFRAGEGVTSRYFAGWMSGFLDWLVCVDPHLHRYDTLDEVYEIPGRVVPTAPLLARWLADHVERPVLVGPDAESSQWVERVAEEADAPSMILEKERRGDRDVRVSVPDVERWRDHTPVLVDDIISTGHTMCETIGHLLDAGLEAPICIGVHAIFADEALDEIREAGAGRVITTNAIAHPTNEIDISDQIVEAVEEFTRP
jgi:ribose-phosphate pyrophosphokinase